MERIQCVRYRDVRERNKERWKDTKKEVPQLEREGGREGEGKNHKDRVRPPIIVKMLVNAL